MRIKTPYISEIASDTYAINEYGIAAMFLVIGKERALLIDTGVGLCDLPGIVRQLTDLPYDVVLTHGHGDHAGGIGHFSRIYIHPDDREMVDHLDLERLKNYNHSLGEGGAFEVYDYDPDAICEIRQTPEWITVREGDVFDLGDRRLSVMEVPGHTAGSIVLLDEKRRILFSGDACNRNLILNSCPIGEAKRNLEKILKIQDKFDQNFNGHIGYMGNPDCFSMPKHVPETCVEICQSILDGTARVEETEGLLGKTNSVTVRGVRVNFRLENV